MSVAASTLTAVQPLLDQGKRSMGSRLRAYAWLMCEVAAAVPKSFGIWIILALAQGLMPPFQLWASGRLVNAIQIEMEGGQAHPWMWAMAMAAALASVRLLAPLMNWAEVTIHERGLAMVHARILSRSTEVDLALLEYQQFYDVTNRIASEANQGLKDCLLALKEFVTNSIPLVGAILLISAIDWRLTLVLILPLLPILTEALRQGGYVWNALREQTHDRRIAQYIADRFSDRQSAKEIRLFGLADELINRWQHHYLHTRKEFRGKTTRAALRVQLSGTWADLVIYAGLIWLITGGFVQPTAAEITVLMGAFMTTGGQTFQLQQAVMSIGNRGGFAQDVRMFLTIPAIWSGTPAKTLGRKPESISLENVRFAYPGTDTNIIDGIDLTIQPGETVAIVGENGAGKTTLLKLMLGLYQPDSGTIRLGSRMLNEIPEDERRARMAAVFQSFARYPDSIRENITLPLDENEAELRRVTQESGLEHLIATSEKGLETLLSPDLGGTDLSGGQWQRVAIARAAYRQASLLALDEPTAALDPLAEVDVFRRFANLSKDRTTLLISHRLGMARLASRIIVLENGKVTEDGTHANLVRSNGHYAELWEMQSRWYQ